MSQNRNHLLTYLGGLMVVVGAFAPLVKLPAIGAVSYYDAANPEVFLLILFAALGPVFIIIQRTAPTALSPVGVWLVLLWPVIQSLTSERDEGLIGRATRTVTDPLETYAANLFTNITELSWGGFVLLVGAVILTVGGIRTTLGGRK
ncbi:MAG: hypothetical protein MI755_23290 [Sphingomonadales bacterium]|nr:hypothetical protein [Sphingomonadales bacterium]